MKAAFISLFSDDIYFMAPLPCELMLFLPKPAPRQTLGPLSCFVSYFCHSKEKSSDISVNRDRNYGQWRDIRRSKLGNTYISKKITGMHILNKMILGLWFKFRY